MKANSLSKILFVTVMMLGAVSVRAAWLATDTTLNAGDTTYDNQDIVVSNCTLTVNGPHGFNSLQVLGGGVVTHSPATTNQYALQLTIVSSLTIDTTSKIDVSARGYLQGRTVGNQSSGGATGAAGGSYGGLGSGVGANPVYGDFRDPNELGSGGGTRWDYAGPGGGLVRITAGTATINGLILARGASGGGGGYPGGSGGGIKLSAGVLAGTGSISADGGNSTYGGAGSGGGGRVAIYYDAISGFDLTNKVTAHGGNDGGGDIGAVGTVYLKQNGGQEVLSIASHGTPVGAMTPLGVSTDSAFSVERLVLSGTNVIAMPEHQMPIQATEVVLQDGAVLTHRPTTQTQEYSLVMTVASNLVIDAESKIDVTGLGYLAGRTLGNTSAGGATGWSGGSYGGRGFSYNGASGVAYGDYRNPNELGSGGGGDGGPAGSGGGLVRITATSATIDGAILANGGQDGWGSGSGGGVWLSVGSISGGGTLVANGGNGVGNSGSGGGGRVAIYYRTLNGFDVGHVTTLGGREGDAHKAAVGTIYLKPLDGLAELRIDSRGQAPGMWTPLGLSTDTAFKVERLVLSGTNVIAMPEHQMPIQAIEVVLQDGAVLTHRPTTQTQEYSLMMTVASNLVIDAASKIDVTGLGYLTGRTLGNTSAGGATGWSGGSYGGRGFSHNNGQSGLIYGDYRNPNNVGSGGGGAEGWAAGAGGGLVQITATQASIDGAIVANGDGGSGGGAGSGGGIRLNMGSLLGAGQIQADGAYGNNNSGGGGGGRVAIYTWTTNALPGTNVLARGGPGASGPGQTGSVYFGTAPFFGWQEQVSLLHGSIQIAWYAFGVDPTTIDTEISAFCAGNSYPIAAGMKPIDSTGWDTTTVPDGSYELRAIFRNASTQVVGDISRAVLVNNSAVWHSGTITGQEVWAPNALHIVEGSLTIATNAQVTIQPGTVVKFAPEARMTVKAGGTLIASGTEGANVAFTALADDTLGGDDNMDGDHSRPQPGAWNGINTESGAVFTFNDQTVFRYMSLVHSGTLTSDETWRGTYLHTVSADLTVPAGKTLNIEPGAVVKIAEGQSILVSAGGFLTANGTVAQPIVFTSFRDDSIAGDSNGDGDKTVPSAGDWKWIYLNGGNGVFNHCWLYYGGGPAEGGWGSPGGPGKATIKTDGAATLSFSNSLIRDSFYDGLLCWGGPVTVVNSVFKGIDRAICAHPGSSVKVVNCTLDDNRVGLLIHGGSLDVANTIVANSFTAGILHDYSADALTVHHTDLWPDNASGTANWQVGANGNISADPKFKNPTNENYRLNFGSPCLDAADGTAAPATDFMGAPRYTDPRSPHAGIITTNGEYADMGAFEFVEDANSPIDLAAIQAEGPVAVTAGESVTVRWQIANVGVAAVSGAWHDEIALVADLPQRGVNRIVVNEVLTSATLGPGESKFFEAAVRVPGGTEGAWRWQVTANSKGEVFEGRNWRNNASPLAAVTVLSVPAIAPGMAVSSRFAGARQASWYKFVQSAGVDMFVTLDAATTNGHCRLYAGFGSMPTEQSFDQRNTEWNAADARMGVAAPTTEQTVYLLVMPETLPDDATAFTLSVDRSTFGLATVDLARAGNAGNATIPIRGSGFNTNLAVLLQPAGGGAAILAQRVLLQDSANALATFPLAGKTPGVCHVLGVQQGLTATLSNAFTIITGLGGRFQAKLVMPKAVRVGRPFAATVEFGNDGDGDVPIPLLAVQSQANYPVWFGGLTATGTATVLQFPALAPENSDGGILRPGEQGRITFYSKLLSGGFAPYTVSWINGDSTEPEDWNAIRAVVRPDNPPSLWDNAWAMLVSEAGPRVGDYIAALARTAAEVRSYGLDYRTPDVLLWFMMEKAMIQYPGASLAGTLFSGDLQHPLAHAALQLTSSSGQYFTVLAGFDGAYAFRDVAPGLYTLSVPGHLLASAMQVTIPSAEPRNVVVSPGAQIAGRIVTASAGSPVVGAIINVIDSVSNTIYSATSDANGGYAVGGLTAGAYRVLCTSGEYLDAEMAAKVAGGQSLAVSFSLTTGASVSGRVRAPDGSGVVMAWVQVFDPASGIVKVATSSTNGQFRIAGLPAATYNLVAKTTNYGAGTLPGIVLASGQNLSNLTVDLSRAAVLNGRIYNSTSGLPIAGASVSAVGQVSGGTPALSDAQGKYTLTGLTPGDQRILASATHYAQTGIPVTLTGGKTSAVDIAMAPLGAIGGFLRSAGGSPLVDMIVSLASTNGNAWSVKTDANGRFDFTGLSNGSFELAVGESLGMNVGRQSIVLSAASNIVNTLIPLTGTELMGKVMNADGTTPASNVVVSLARQGRLLAETITDRSGSYRYLVFDSEPVDVVAMGSSIGFQRLTNIAMTGGLVTNPNLVGGQSKITIAVSAHATVPAQSGSAPAIKPVLLLRPATDYPSSFLILRQADASNQASFPNLTYGRYLVDITCDGWGSQTVPVTLSADTLTVAVDLASGGILQGYVKNDSGVILPYAQVTMCAIGSEQTIGSGFTDGNGFYRLTTLPIGEYRLVVTARSKYVATQQPITINNLTIPTQLDVVLGTSGTVVRGWARNDAGQSVIGAQIALQTSGGITLQSGSVQADGTYRLGPVGPGSYQLVASAIGPGTTTSNLSLTGESEQTMNLTIPRAAAIALPTDSTLIANGMVKATSVADELGTLRASGLLSGQVFSDWTVEAPARVSDDTEEWRTRFYNYPPRNPNCNAYLAAKTEAAHSLWWLNYEYGAWEQAYGALSDSEKASMGLIATHFAKVALKITVLIETWPYAMAKLGIPVPPEFSDLEQWVSNLGQRLASIHEDFYSPTLSGEKAGLDTVLKFLLATKATVVDLIAKKALLGPLAGFVDIAFEIRDEIDAFEQAFKDSSNMQRSCINAQSQYYSWLKIHQANLAKVLAASQQDCPDCKDKCTGCPPPAPRPGEEFIPQPPPPRNPCCGVVGPCPPPCQHCPNGGSNSSGTTGGGSIDPNDKQATGYGKGSMIQAGARVTFLIRFENKTNATAAAQQVTVTDPLSPDFDYSTVELLDLGFNNVDVIVPRGLSQFETNGIRVATDPNPVRVVAGLNPDTGVLSWLIESVSEITGGLPEDPLAGFLPPNDAQHRGEGYVSYSVCVRTNVANGASITNQARIVFDVNPPIDTPMVTNQVDLLAPLSSVQPLPGISATTFEVKWSGADEEQGSGLAGFDIYVSTDNRAFVQWLTGVTNNSASFTGQPGSTYRFFSIARDNVGNVEAPPPSADATTMIQAQSSSAGLQISYRPPSSVQISWPTSMVHYVLQAIPAFNAAQNWRSVTDLPSVVGDRFVLTLGALEATHYYRLYALPQLSIQQTNGLLMLSWPKSATDFRLEVREDLLPATQWQPVSDVPLTDNNRNVLIVTPVTPSRYYRLVSP